MKKQLILALVLLTAPLVATGSAASSELPVAWSADVPGSAAFGIRAEAGASGRVDVSLRGDVPTASTGSLAAYLYDSEGTLVMSMIQVGFSSPDRWTVVTDGNGTGLGAPPLPDGVDLDFIFNEPRAACPFACLDLQFRGQPGRVFNVVAWIGAVEETTLRVRADEDARVTVNTGRALVMGDPELEDAATNVQVQSTLAGPVAVGAKIIRDARVPFHVDHALRGLWAHADFKAACAPLLSCVGAVEVDRACAAATGLACGHARISHAAPDGTTRTGESTYWFHEHAPGTHAFVVDEKVDAYVTREFVDLVLAGVIVNENYGYLSVSDVALPG